MFLKAALLPDQGIFGMLDAALIKAVELDPGTQQLGLLGHQCSPLLSSGTTAGVSALCCTGPPSLVSVALMSVMTLMKNMHFGDPSALETVCRFLNKCSLWEKVAELSLLGALAAREVIATRREHSLLSLAGFASVDKTLSSTVRFQGQI